MVLCAHNSHMTIKCGMAVDTELMSFRCAAQRELALFLLGLRSMA